MTVKIKIIFVKFKNEFISVDLIISHFLAIVDIYFNCEFFIFKQYRREQAFGNFFI